MDKAAAPSEPQSGHLWNNGTACHVATHTTDAWHDKQAQITWQEQLLEAPVSESSKGNVIRTSYVLNRLG
eukprot:1944638-Amphidinium_carterae.1